MAFVQLSTVKCPFCGMFIYRSSGCPHMHCQKPAGCDKHFCYDCGGKYDASGHHTCKYVSTAEYACSCASSRRLDCPNRSRVHNTSTPSAAPRNGRCSRSSAVQILCFVAQHSVGVIRKSYAWMAVCAEACGARTHTVVPSRPEARGGGAICMLNVVCASHGSYAHCRKFEADPKREAAAVKVDFLHHHRRRFETHTQARLWPAKMRGSAGSAAASCCSAAQDGRRRCCRRCRSTNGCDCLSHALAAWPQALQFERQLRETVAEIEARLLDVVVQCNTTLCTHDVRGSMSSTLEALLQVAAATTHTSHAACWMLHAACCASRVAFLHETRTSSSLHVAHYTVWRMGVVGWCVPQPGKGQPLLCCAGACHASQLVRFRVLPRGGDAGRAAAHLRGPAGALLTVQRPAEYTRSLSRAACSPHHV